MFTNASGNLTVTLKNVASGITMTLLHDKNMNNIQETGEQLSSVTTTSGGAVINASLTQALASESYFIKISRGFLAIGTNYGLDVSYDTAGSTLATARPINDAAGAFGVHDVLEGVTLSDTVDIYSFVFDSRFSSAVFSTEVVAPIGSRYHIDIIRDSNNNRVIDAGELQKTFETFGSPITLTQGAAYYLRIVRAELKLENYRLKTQFDFFGNSIPQANDIGTFFDLVQNFREQVCDKNFIAEFDSDDFYKIRINHPLDLCLQLVITDTSPATNQLIARVIRDANKDNSVGAGEELARVVTGSNGVATLNFPLAIFEPETVYYLDIKSIGSANYSLALSADSTPGIIPSNRYSNSQDVGTVTGLTQLSGGIGPTDGVAGDPSDTFKFKLPAAGRLSARLSNVASSSTFSAFLHSDSNGDGIVQNNEQIAIFDNTTPFIRDLAAGTYFITVLGPTVFYSLTLTPDFAGDLSNPRNTGTLGAFTQVSDHISALDADVYRFGISGTQNFTANGQAGQTNLTFFLALGLGGGANTFLTQAAGTGGFTQLQKSLSAGSYFLVVSGAQDSDYTIGFSTGDNDDSISEASLVANHRVVVGESRDFTVGDAGDVDIVKIDLGGAIGFAVDIDSRGGSSFDTFVRIFDNNGNQLATNDDGVAPGESASKFSFLTFAKPVNTSNKFFFVGVSSAHNKNYNPNNGSGDSGGSTSGQYTISITPFTPPSGWIGGFVYNDLDGDGVKDANESAIAGRTVFADLNNNGALDVNEKTAITDVSGQYILNSLTAGTYKVRQILPVGWTQTFPLNNFGRMPLRLDRVSRLGQRQRP